MLVCKINIIFSGNSIYYFAPYNLVQWYGLIYFEPKLKDSPFDRRDLGQFLLGVLKKSDILKCSLPYASGKLFRTKREEEE